MINSPHPIYPNHNYSLTHKVRYNSQLNANANYKRTSIWNGTRMRSNDVHTLSVWLRDTYFAEQIKQYPARWKEVKIGTNLVRLRLVDWFLRRMGKYNQVLNKKPSKKRFVYDDDYVYGAKIVYRLLICQSTLLIHWIGLLAITANNGQNKQHRSDN